MTNDNISTHEMWDSLHEEVLDRRTEMTEMKIRIAILHRERDEARREVCKNAGILRSVVDPDQDVQDWAKYIARVKKWDCYEKETT